MQMATHAVGVLSTFIAVLIYMLYVRSPMLKSNSGDTQQMKHDLARTRKNMLHLMIILIVISIGIPTYWAMKANT